MRWKKKFERVLCWYFLFKSIICDYHWNLWGAILPSWLTLYVWTKFASIIVGWWDTYTGSWVIWMRLFTMKRGLFVLKTSSLREIPSRYCLSKDLSIWLSLLKVYFCFWIASLSKWTLLNLLKKLFKYLNYSYY